MTRQVLNEKYRPDTIEGYVFPDENVKRKVSKWISEQTIPNILMVGPAGVGKTTLSRILINELGIEKADVKTVNFSKDGKIGYVRDELEPWLKKAPYGRMKVVQMEEMDRISPDAQKALRAIIEEATAKGVRFVGTCNYPKGIIPELHSRFQGGYLEIKELDEEALIDHMINIIEDEQIIVNDDADFLSHIDAYKPDMRKIINSIEGSLDIENVLHPAIHGSSSGSDLDEWVAMWASDDAIDVAAAMSLSELIDQTNYDFFYQTMYENSSKFPDEAKGLVLLSQYLDRAQTSANQRLHLDAFLAHIFLLEGDE